MHYLNPATTTPQLQPFFAAAALDYVNALSERLLADPACRELPDLLALGFWFRRQKIAALRQKYQAMPYQMKPLGLVFHNTPANVDSLFMYPALLSLLCGNYNLIRLSSRAGQSAAVLLKHVNALAATYPAQNAALQFIQAPHQDASLLATLHRLDGRVLWGSDAAIIAQRQLAVAAHCRDLCFSHKLSLTLLDAQALCQAPVTEFQAMTELFSRDHLTYAQQACASAKVVVWLGQPETIRQAQHRFWPALSELCQQKARLTDSEAYQALAGAQQLLLSSDSYQEWQSGQLQRLQIQGLDADMLRLHPGCGLFLELSLQSLYALTPMLDNHHQTLSYWGIDSKLLDGWYPTVLRGADRLVPLGQSLQFAEVWDGVDLLLQLSRTHQCPS
ncbi:acyl-CoA reductase [Rheinheimera sp.]|uniref:acyl-CoA reductase n=1 Tax=Rheinheimera sp. TaxID=1869214 RepID=UPI003D2D11AD